MTRPPTVLFRLVLGLTLSWGATGCGGSGDRPELGKVSGTVKMDGKPLSGVIVVFKPDAGRAATGIADAAGKYQLTYLHGVNGAKVGPSTVSFEWPLGTSGPAIPEKYAAKSELKVEVKMGSNTLDFNLEPAKPGEAVSPPQAD